MARLALTALALTGAAATLALLLRGWRAGPRARAPWFALAASAAIETAWLLVRATLGAEAGGGPTVGSPLLVVAAQVLGAGLTVVGLLGLPTAAPDVRHRLQDGVDAVVAGLALALLVWQLVLPVTVPAGGGVRQVLAVVQGAAAVVVVTAALTALSRSRYPGGLPADEVQLLAGGLVVHVVGAVVLSVGLAEGTRGWVLAGFVAAGLGFSLAGVGAWLGARRVTAASPSTAGTGARPRHGAASLAVVAPTLPLVAAGALVLYHLLTRTPLDRAALVMGGTLLLALLAGGILARLETLRMSHTFEHRVSERTLDLGTREKWFRSLVQHANDVVVVLDGHGIVRYATPSLARVLGHDPEQVLGTPFETLLRPEDEERVGDLLLEAVQSPGDSCSLELSLWHAGGRWRLVEATAVSLLDDVDIRGLVLTLRDVSERRQLEEQLTEQAFTDPLTGLANRAFFLGAVRDSLTAAQPGTVAVLFVDLDGFKQVNDTQGHAVGDRLLALVGSRLRGCVRPGDVVARLGGDEFGILLVGDDAEAAASWVARRIGRQLAHEFRLDGRLVTVAGSTGFALNDGGAADADTLLRNADLAMYRAKAQAQASFVRFEEAMHEALLDRVRTEEDLRRALPGPVGSADVARGGQLAVHFQPLVELDSSRIVGAEALVRWRHPERGLLTPDAFISLAEDTGLINELGAWALREACRTAVAWLPQGGADDPFRLGVNVSVRQLLPGFPRLVRQALQDTGFPADALTLEVTESLLLDRTDETLALLQQLRALGVRFALDDFGTGYSSLAYLSTMPVDSLKIDMSFVSPLGLPGEAGEVARTIIGLGEALRLTTVAEGIEEVRQRDALLAMGCRLGQGWLYGRAVPAEAFGDLLAGGPLEPVTPSRAVAR